MKFLELTTDERKFLNSIICNGDNVDRSCAVLILKKADIEITPLGMEHPESVQHLSEELNVRNRKMYKNMLELLKERQKKPEIYRSKEWEREF
ncbi:MAG: hypothetical protein JXR78_10300 [Victivallales bacterium]|nr:hypothetical protein [Victivallales bacterium]